MKTPIYIEGNAIPNKLKGGYKGRKFKVTVTADPVTLNDTYWSGGTRSTYSLVNLETGAAKRATGTALDPPQFGGAQSPIKVIIPPNHALREQSIFQGKDMGLTFYIHPDNAAKFLPPDETLTPAEQCVLEFTARRKASYNGQNRFDMHIDETRWNKQEPFSMEQWTAAQESLQERKLLRKNNSITPAGRNAVADKREYCR